LEPFLDQLVVYLPLPLDLLRGLELGGKPCLQLAEPDIVKTCRIHMIASDLALGARTELDGTVDGPM
jgi:hypothetical protein